MVHSITQLALFGNGLFELVMINGTTTACFYQLMLVNIYHILTCNEADQ